MRWFKKHKDSGRLGAAKQKAACKIVLWLWKIQTAFAKWMDRKINPLPSGRKKYLLFGFCFMLSAYSLWLIVSPLVETKKSVEIKIQAMRLPKAASKVPEHLTRPFVSRDEYLRIHGFKMFLDSVASDPNGKTIYDSLVAKRPGLVDSLKMIEEYYQIQK